MQIIIVITTTEVSVILFISKIIDSSAKTLMFCLYKRHKRDKVFKNNKQTPKGMKS